MKSQSAARKMSKAWETGVSTVHFPDGGPGRPPPGGMLEQRLKGRESIRQVEGGREVSLQQKEQHVQGL